MSSSTASSREQIVALLCFFLGPGPAPAGAGAYASQPAPRGIADALLVAESFLDADGCVLALGDNLFWGYLDFLREALTMPDGATVFSYRVQNPSGYGVVELDDRGQPTSMEEKPEHPQSHLVLPGLYVLDADAVTIARATAPSPRGELEITDVLREYLRRGQLRVKPLGRGMAWLDMGTPEGLLGASEFVATIQARQGLYVGCLEEVALRMGWRTPEQLRVTVGGWPAGPYRAYVEALLA